MSRDISNAVATQLALVKLNGSQNEQSQVWQGYWSLVMDKMKADRNRKEIREAGKDSVMRRCYMLYKNVIYVCEIVNQQN